MVELTPGELLIVMLAPIAGVAAIILIKNARRITDMWNLRFRRARTVRADMHTQSGRVVTRFVVPDDRGLFRHRDGAYHFPPEGYEIDARYSIPKADFIEVQIPAEAGRLEMSEHEVEVTVMKDGASTTETKKVPQFLISHSRIRPRLLPLARRDEKTGKVKMTDEPPVTSLEIADALDSKIVQEVTSASIADLQMNRVFILQLILVGVLVLGLIAIYAKLNSMESAIQAAQTLVVKTGK